MPAIASSYDPLRIGDQEYRDSLARRELGVGEGDLPDWERPSWWGHTKSGDEYDPFGHK
jgi:hypothetical protein